MRTWYKLAQTAQIEQQTIGPVYHGSPFKFNPEELQAGHSGVLFFSDNYYFADEYGKRKSFENKMDADVQVVTAYLKGRLFDPQNQSHVKAVTRYLGQSVKVYNDFGMTGDIPIEEWKSFLLGDITTPPFFSDKDLQGKKPGDPLPQNEVFDRPMTLELLELTPNEVKCADRGTIYEIIAGKYCFGYEYERNKGFSVEEVAGDIVHLDRMAFMQKYRDMNRKHSFHVMSYPRTPVTTKNNDIWRWLEGEGVFNAIQTAGFDIVKSREGGKTTYAVLPSAEVIVKDDRK
jgi:hypothetical protein